MNTVSYINPSKLGQNNKRVNLLLLNSKYFILAPLMLCFLNKGFAIESSTIGDFNGDSFPDIVIGNFSAKVNKKVSSGAVQIQYGTNRGIAFGHIQNINQDSPGIPGSSAVSNNFGFSVAKGDFDNDGFDDLVIGAPGNNFSSNGSTLINNSGAITALYGSSNGLQTNQRVQQLTQNSPGILGSSEKSDKFGQALATGDFNGDGFEDLAVSATGESIESENQIFAGAVNIIQGSSTGLSSTGGQIWTLEELGFKSKSHDNFGIATATGDFNHDGFDDLAISAPFKKVDNKDNSGALYIVYGSETGLHRDKSQSIQRWVAGANNFPGEPKNNSNLGRSLAVGNFNGDDFDDIAIGITGAETIVVLKGSNSGLNAIGFQEIKKTTSGIPGTTGIGSDFGWALTARDVNSDGFDDLFLGARAAPVLGSMMVSLNGSANGLNAVKTRYWSSRSVMLAFPSRQTMPARSKISRPTAPSTGGDVIKPAEPTSPRGRRPKAPTTRGDVIQPTKPTTKPRDHRTKAPPSKDDVIDQ